ncbi:hypothetical protein [Cohnella faecalis]|uniref:Uncharacterized protein n=1 Tax=Cohnella faecalis TaxID=2315694 RepID=A0A398CJU5_9BACL|nr:hypothetical protein [Cohnella faecalis]RIE02580.1 hypothetical protein D3H35_18015 [Cohnella faecalis]
MTRAERTFVTRCSLAVRPIDSWTGRPPGGSSLTVRLLETGRKPVQTSDGSYAFLDFADSACTLVIGSPTYLEVRRTLDLTRLDPRMPTVTVSMLPNRAYPPPAASTGLVFTVCNPAGDAVPGAEVSAYIDDEAAIRGRVAEEKTERGAQAVLVAPGGVRLSSGDSFVLRERTGTAEEWGFVDGIDGSGNRLLLGGRYPAYGAGVRSCSGRKNPQRRERTRYRSFSRTASADLSGSRGNLFGRQALYGRMDDGSGQCNEAPSRPTVSIIHCALRRLDDGPVFLRA